MPFPTIPKYAVAQKRAAKMLRSICSWIPTICIYLTSPRLDPDFPPRMQRDNPQAAFIRPNNSWGVVSIGICEIQCISHFNNINLLTSWTWRTKVLHKWFHIWSHLIFTWEGEKIQSFLFLVKYDYKRERWLNLQAQRKEQMKTSG